MTDKQLDTLLKNALRPDTNPPELNLLSPQPVKHKRGWPTLVAACLCLAVSAGVALHFSPAFDVKGNAAPESAYDNFMSTTGSNNSGSTPDGYGVIADQSQNDVGKQHASDQELVDPSSPAASPQYSHVVGSALLIPYATAREQSLIRKEAKTRLGEGTLQYTLMGKTERWLSIRAASTEDVAYITVDRRSQNIATLHDLLQDDAYAKLFFDVADTAVGFYVNSNGELIIVQ